MNWDIAFYEEIDSTNLEIRRKSIDGARQGLVVLADKQNEGKGRRGRVWESPAGENLYFSILLRPKFAPEKAPMLTILMAHTVARVLEKMFYSEMEPIQIKWPNDVIISNKKVCGILTEMNLNGCQIEDVIIGVGINVNRMTFSEELEDKATSLRLEFKEEVEREVLLSQILCEFAEQYETFVEIQDLSFVKEAYNKMLVNQNREVMVLEPSREYQAQALGINEIGKLLVKKEDGSIDTVYAGEVSVRGVYGYV